ncbi:DUF202 domain-containing protein [Actinokineospora sp. G85]|uniref:DUF202 domain-containing protein n=1 Tax=Actinokineospora sp. G85 TaxID=3406626 RepID=UPI003C7632AA
MSGERVLDPGLQAERTRLAWSRTALTAAACGALLLHAARSVAGVVGGVVVLGLACALLVCGAARYRHVRRSVAAGEPVAAGWPRVVAPVAVLVAPLAALVVVLDR